MNRVYAAILLHSSKIFIGSFSVDYSNKHLWLSMSHIIFLLSSKSRQSCILNFLCSSKDSCESHTLVTMWQCLVSSRLCLNIWAVSAENQSTEYVIMTRCLTTIEDEGCPQAQEDKGNPSLSGQEPHCNQSQHPRKGAGSRLSADRLNVKSTHIPGHLTNA